MMFKITNKGNNIVLITLIIIIVGSYTLGGGFYKKEGQTNLQSLVPGQYEIVYPTGMIKSNNLQIGAFFPILLSPRPTPIVTNPTITQVPASPTPRTPTPGRSITPTPPEIFYPPDTETPTLPPGNYCTRDTFKTPDCICLPDNREEFICYNSPDICESYGSGYPNCQIPPADQDKYRNNPNCGPSCIDKPVIYLYPTKPTFVTVKLKIPGKVVISDPLYPNDGWKNVLAYPDGTLFYKGKKYKELFYESKVDIKINPKKGIIIPIEKLNIELSSIIDKLGLIGPEKQEFMEYWIPRLSKLNAKYIFFSVLTKEEKESIDHVDVMPPPDTRIEFLVYFKKLEKPIHAESLILPDSPPQRKGFIFVEWGGMVGN